MALAPEPPLKPCVTLWNRKIGTVWKLAGVLQGCVNPSPVFGRGPVCPSGVREAALREPLT